MYNLMFQIFIYFNAIKKNVAFKKEISETSKIGLKTVQRVI